METRRGTKIAYVAPKTKAKRVKIVEPEEPAEQEMETQSETKMETHAIEFVDLSEESDGETVVDLSGDDCSCAGSDASDDEGAGSMCWNDDGTCPGCDREFEEFPWTKDCEVCNGLGMKNGDCCDNCRCGAGDHQLRTCGGC